MTQNFNNWLKNRKLNYFYTYKFFLLIFLTLENNGSPLA